MTRTAKVLLIMGSTRAGRLCPRIATWVRTIGLESTSLDYEIIDLVDWNLPSDDEPAIPAIGPYQQPHTQAWSAKVGSADAVVFVTPQYNWGYPAVLKNAIDHLYSEWRSKPAAIITYGGHGGTRCARQLRRVATSLRMNVVATAAALTLSDAVIREGKPFEPERDFAAGASQVKATLHALTGCVEGRETLLARMRGKWAALVATLS